jgi:hypothetical protein
MKAVVEDRAKTFDANGQIKRLVDESLERLQEFRKRFPYAEDTRAKSSIISCLDSSNMKIQICTMNGLIRSWI